MRCAHEQEAAERWGVRVLSFEQLLALGAAHPVKPEPCELDDDACIFFTAGSSGGSAKARIGCSETQLERPRCQAERLCTCRVFLSSKPQFWEPSGTSSLVQTLAFLLLLASTSCCPTCPPHRPSLCSTGAAPPCAGCSAARAERSLTHSAVQVPAGSYACCWREHCVLPGASPPAVHQSLYGAPKQPLSPVWCAERPRGAVRRHVQGAANGLCGYVRHPDRLPARDSAARGTLNDALPQPAQLFGAVLSSPSVCAGQATGWLAGQAVHACDHEPAQPAARRQSSQGAGCLPLPLVRLHAAQQTG